MFRRLSLAAGITTVITALTCVAAAAASAVPTDGKFQAQIAANHLSPAQARTLQAHVDRVVARTGGTQVAINQVAWKGGDTLISLPGESRARELGVAPKAGTVEDCDYYQFCTYGTYDYAEMIDRMSSCTWHITHGWIFVAYVNNQTPGTRARFYDKNRKLITYTMPAFYKGSTPVGFETHYIRPC